MNSEVITTTENTKTDFPWWALPMVYGVMVVVIAMMRGIPSGTMNSVADVMIQYAAEAFAPLIIAMFMACAYHRIRQGKSACVRNTVLTSIVLFGFYFVRVSGF